MAGPAQRPVVFLIGDNSAAFWDLMANYLGVPRQLLDRKQAEIIYHNWTPVLVESTVFPGADRQHFPHRREAHFAGKIIITRIASYSPVPVGTDVRATLKGLAPGLSLREDKAVFSTSAFSVIDGALVSDTNADDAAGGVPRPSLLVVGVSPKIGQGSKMTFRFTYLDSYGESEVDRLLININSPGKDTDGCYLSLKRDTGQLALVLDGDKSWDVGVLGTNSKMENRNCIVDLADCS